MDIVKTAKYVKKEVLRSPVKTGAMGVLTLVAVFYCGPVFWSLLPFSKGSSDSVAADSPAATPDLPSPTLNLPTVTGNTIAPDPNTDNSSDPNWTEIAKQAESDTFKRPVRRAIDARNPFAEIVKESPVNVVAQDPKEPEQPKFTIDQIDLKLRGVFVGRTRMASINDQVVIEKGRFDVPHPSNPETMRLALELRHVDSDFIVIGYEEQSRKIELSADKPRATQVATDQTRDRRGVED